MASTAAFPFPEPFVAWVVAANPRVDTLERKARLNFLTAPLSDGDAEATRRVIPIFDSLESASRFARDGLKVDQSQARLRCLKFNASQLLGVLRSLHEADQVHGVMHGPRKVRPGLRLHVFEIEQVIMTLEQLIRR